MPVIEEMLKVAKEAGASDLHITVGVPPKMRINGKLVTMSYGKMLPADTKKLLDEIMSTQQKKSFEQCGEYDMCFSIPDHGRYRVNAYKQRGSVALAFRLVGTQVPSAESLGLPESVAALYRRERGLVLVTGPDGSGVSTTLAALVDKINQNRECHVITLEDPIEYLHHHQLAMVNQREIGLDSQNYASALRAALREDPDVILIGELCDPETISMAISAAESGHLVLAALHTIGVERTIDRIVDVFPISRQQQIRVQLSGVLEAAVSQQLLPKADGCGRIAAFEVLHGNQTVRDLVREGRTDQLVGVMQANLKMGMINMDEMIMQLYSKGLVNRESAVQYAMDPESMAKKIPADK